MGVLAAAASLIWPTGCAGCGRDAAPLCDACRAALVPHPLQRAVAGLVVHAALEYDGVVRAIVNAAKEQGRPGLSVPLGRALAGAAAAVRLDAPPVRPLVVVPVPSAPAAVRRRGRRPVEELCRAAGLPPHRLLRLVRAVRDQAGLADDERRRNVASAMRADAAVADRAVLIVDDVVTSGATLAEAFRAVRAAGGVPIGAVAVASTPLRRAPPHAPPPTPPVP